MILTGNVRSDIYWANSLFSEADRHLNRRYAVRLRSLGYTVFLPQETDVNHRRGAASPAAYDIFRVDTGAILNSRLMIACIDQETIDSGVACEIGIAYSYGIPIIGLYTDIRQYREGRGKIYKNLYVIGAIESSTGAIASSESELVEAVSRYFREREKTHKGRLSQKQAASHFDCVAPIYQEYVSRLESLYQPRWRAEEVVESWVNSSGSRRVLDFGCATGSLGDFLRTRVPDISYVGYDLSPAMTEVASTAHGDDMLTFTSSWRSVVAYAKQIPFDMAVVLFTLHDLEDKKEVISRISQQIRQGGYLLIVDLSASDLPALTDLLQRYLARPALDYDTRLEPVSLSAIARASGLSLVECQLALPQVVFPAAEDIDEYLMMFGIYEGMDLPLGIEKGNARETRMKIRDLLVRQTYPFYDQRVFTICALQKNIGGI